MAFKRASLVKETTVSTGTGTITLAGSVTNYRAVSAVAASGDEVPYFIDARPVAWEAGIGTYVFTGGVHTLQRTTVVENDAGTTALRTLPSGTKAVYLQVSQAIQPVLNRLSTITANWQLSQGVKLLLDTDGDSYIWANADDLVQINAGVAQMEISETGNKFFLTRSDSAEGPLFSFIRYNLTPAVNDTLGTIYFQGRTSTQALASYVKIRTRIKNVTNGATAGEFIIDLHRGGTVTRVVDIDDSLFRIENNTGLMVQKSAAGLSNIGMEMKTTGQLDLTASGLAPLRLNRQTSDGTMIELYKDQASVANATLASGFVTWGNFAGAHPFAPALGLRLQDIPPGTILASTGRPMPTPMGPDERHMVCELAGPRDRRFYGVAAGEVRQSYPCQGGIIRVRYGNAVAVGLWPVRVDGPVEPGDHLASKGDGVAQRAPRRQRGAIVATAMGYPYEKDGLRLVSADLARG